MRVDIAGLRSSFLLSITQDFVAYAVDYWYDNQCTQGVRIEWTIGDWKS